MDTKRKQLKKWTKRAKIILAGQNVDITILSYQEGMTTKVRHNSEQKLEKWKGKTKKSGKKLAECLTKEDEK